MPTYQYKAKTNKEAQEKCDAFNPSKTNTEELEMECEAMAGN